MSQFEDNQIKLAPKSASSLRHAIIACLTDENVPPEFESYIVSTKEEVKIFNLSIDKELLLEGIYTHKLISFELCEFKELVSFAYSHLSYLNTLLKNAGHQPSMA